jgi:ABC-type uncharacterized transport system substrate-binding protein
VPIVFVNATDPVGGGLVASLARPGGNTTGFTQFEFGLSAKWLELLKEIAPAITRVAVIRDPTARTGGGQLGAIQAVALTRGVKSQSSSNLGASVVHARNHSTFISAQKSPTIFSRKSRYRRHNAVASSLPSSSWK